MIPRTAEDHICAQRMAGLHMPKVRKEKTVFVILDLTVVIIIER